MSNLSDFVIVEKFDGDQQSLVLEKYTGTDEHVVVPENVTKIDWRAFSRCKTLKSVEIPDSVKDIDPHSFDDCGATLADENGFCCVGKFLINYTGISETVIVPEGVEILGRYAFYGCGNLAEVHIPGSVKIIGSMAFAKCSALRTVVMENGVEQIDTRAFLHCGELCHIEIPQSITEIRSDAFYGCPYFDKEQIPQALVAAGGADYYAKLGIGDENGCIIKDGVLERFFGKPGVIRVTDGVKTIKKDVFTEVVDYRSVPQIILPDSLKLFEESDLGYEDIDINIPAGYLRQTKKLPAKFTDALLSGPWKNKATTEDYACLYLFQGGNALGCRSLSVLQKAPENGAKVLLEILKVQKKAAYFVKAAEFILENKAKISQEVINDFYTTATTAKATEAADLIHDMASVSESTAAPKDNAAVAKPSAVNVHSIEAFCKEHFAEYFLDKTIKKTNLNAKLFDSVLYRDDRSPVPAFVVKCAVVPYIDLMESRPKNISSYKSGYIETHFCQDSDTVAAELETESFIDVLEKIANITYGYETPQCLLPLCRFGTGDHIKSIIAAMNKWGDWYSYSSSGRSAIIVARGGIMLNDSREAMLHAEKCEGLCHYASIRNTDEDSIRDLRLADFGFDESGKKQLDLGNTVIELSVNTDLTLSLFDQTAGKTVKSLPKKGSDAEKFEAASAVFSDLKKNIKKVIKSRNDLLFEMFLNGSTRPAKGWMTSYLSNPILHRVAELVVWNQGEKTFVLSQKGPVDSTGAEYAIDEKLPVGVAHPVMMDAEDIRRWQKYFVSNGLKQPFEQVWEPVIPAAEVKADRYAGCMIPYYRFLGQEKHGIYVEDNDFHNEITITFDGCKADVNRIDYRRHDIARDDRFEISSFTPSGKWTRVTNHLVAYLDRATIYGRIAADDVAVAAQLPGFTLAQVSDFIRYALENKAANVTALLLNFKNEHFADFDPMEEFTLE